MITFLKRDLNSLRDEPCEDPGAQELTIKGKTRTRNGGANIFDVFER